MNKLTAIFLVLVLALTGLSFAQESSSTEGHSDSTMTDMSDSSEHSDGMMDGDGMKEEDSMMDGDSMKDGDAMMDSDAMMMEENRPDWHSLELVSAITGETFTLASLSGKTVFVEPMATWCTNCSRQLSAVNDAKAQLMAEELGEDFVFLALSVEGNLANEKLASHAERIGSTIDFAVATPDLIRGISDSHGRGALNPPSTPHFIIKSNGEMTEVQTGMESSQEIYDELIAAHASGMMMMEQSN